MSQIYTIVSTESENTIRLKTGELVEKKEYSENELDAFLQQTFLWEIVKHIEEDHDHEEYGETTSSKNLVQSIEPENMLISDNKAIGCVVEDMVLLFNNAGEKVTFAPYSYNLSRIHSVYAAGHYFLRQAEGYGADWMWEPSTATITIMEKMLSVPQFLVRKVKNLIIESSAAMEDIKVIPELPCMENVEIRGDISSVREKTFYKCPSLKKVILPESVEIIEKYAFYECKNLEVIELPNVKEIMERAFDGCVNLKAVKGLCKLRKLGESVFSGCESLEEFYIGSALEPFDVSAFYMCKSLRAFAVDPGNGDFAADNGILYDKSKSKLILYPSSSKVEEYVIPRSIIELNPGSFSECRFIKRIVLHDEITTIPASCFAGCESLEVIDCFNHVTEIGAYAFTRCQSLIEFTLPRAAVLGEAAFRHCFNIEGIILPESLEVIPKNLFEGCKSLVNIVLPKTLTKIQERAFANCTALKTIDIPENVDQIGKEAFDYCRELREITIRNAECQLNCGFYGCEHTITIKYPACAKFIDSIRRKAYNFNFEVLDGIRFKDKYGNIIEGHFDKNLSGTGICRFKKQDYGIARKYTGEFANGEISGQGVLTLTVYDKFVNEYTGQFARGVYHGHGTIRYNDDALITGEFKDGEPWNAEGTYKKNYDRALCDSCESVYIGKWLEGKFTGNGVEKYQRGSWWKGSWINGEKDKMEDSYRYPPVK